MKYFFEIQALQRVIVEADDVEEARMMLIDQDEIPTLLNTSCDDLRLDVCISGGGEASDYYLELDKKGRLND